MQTRNQQLRRISLKTTYQLDHNTSSWSIYIVQMQHVKTSTRTNNILILDVLLKASIAGSKENLFT